MQDVFFDIQRRISKMKFSDTPPEAAKKPPLHNKELFFNNAG